MAGRELRRRADRLARATAFAGVETVTERSRSEYIRKQFWDAHSQLYRHELLAETYWGGGARWVIGQRDSVHSRCEIIAGIFGSLIVHGDYDVCRFAHGGGTPWDCLRWMADHTDFGYYVMQKASIGTGHSHVWTFDADVARHDLREFLADRDEDEDFGALKHLFEEVSALDLESEAQLHAHLNESDLYHRYDLWECSFGRVPEFRVVVSWAALNKCAWLLREKYGHGGLPQCKK